MRDGKVREQHQFSKKIHCAYWYHKHVRIKISDIEVRRFINFSPTAKWEFFLTYANAVLSNENAILRHYQAKTII